MTRNAKDSKVNASYNVQADMYSLGIILFEMFHPPFETYMERSETLAKLRGDSHKSKTDDSNSANSEDDLTARQSRFPKSFIEATPENAQRVILWCLDRRIVVRDAQRTMARGIFALQHKLSNHTSRKALQCSYSLAVPNILRRSIAFGKSMLPSNVATVG